MAELSLQREGATLQARLTPWDERALGFATAEITGFEAHSADSASHLLAEAERWAHGLGVRYLVDLGANRLLTLRARVDNVFNKNHWSSVGGYPGANYLVLGAPRTFALNATVEF